MNKKQLKDLERFLDSRFDLAMQTDKEQGNANANGFLNSNADFVYYSGALAAITALGLYFERNNGKHKVYKF